MMVDLADLVKATETLINGLRRQFATSGGAQKLGYHDDISRFLRVIRLTSHLAWRINHHAPNCCRFVRFRRLLRVPGLPYAVSARLSLSCAVY